MLQFILKWSGVSIVKTTHCKWWGWCLDKDWPKLCWLLGKPNKECIPWHIISRMIWNWNYFLSIAVFSSPTAYRFSSNSNTLSSLWDWAFVIASNYCIVRLRSVSLKWEEWILTRPGALKVSITTGGSVSQHGIHSIILVPVAPVLLFVLFFFYEFITTLLICPIIASFNELPNHPFDVEYNVEAGFEWCHLPAL